MPSTAWPGGGPVVTVESARRAWPRDHSRAQVAVDDASEAPAADGKILTQRVTRAVCGMRLRSAGTVAADRCGCFHGRPGAGLTMNRKFSDVLNRLCSRGCAEGIACPNDLVCIRMKHRGVESAREAATAGHATSRGNHADRHRAPRCEGQGSLTCLAEARRGIRAARGH